MEPRPGRSPTISAAPLIRRPRCFSVKNSHSAEQSSYVSASNNPSAQPSVVAAEAPLSGRNDILWGRIVLALVLSLLIIGAALVAEARL